MWNSVINNQLNSYNPFFLRVSWIKICNCVLLAHGTLTATRLQFLKLGILILLCLMRKIVHILFSSLCKLKMQSINNTDNCAIRFCDFCCLIFGWSPISFRRRADVSTQCEMNIGADGEKPLLHRKSKEKVSNWTFMHAWVWVILRGGTFAHFILLCHSPQPPHHRLFSTLATASLAKFNIRQRKSR